MSEPLRVFLCHASQDKPVVQELFNALKFEDWIDPWLDKEKILPGQDWQEVVEKAVDDADVTIICLSNQSVMKDGYVQKEIRFAYDLALEKTEGTIYLIPLRLDEVSLIPRRLHTFQWMDYFGDQKQSEYLKLLASLRLRYAQKIKKENPSISSGIDKFQQQVKQGKSVPSEFVDRGSYEKTILEKIKSADTQKPDRKAEQKVEEAPSGKRPSLIALIISGIVLLAAILCIIGIVSLGKGFISPAMPTAVVVSTLTNAPTGVATEAPIEVVTEAPTEMATETLTVTAPTLLPAITSYTPYAEKDGMTMIDISAGEFLLGSDKGDADEKPLQTMFLDAFLIDQTEVTNKMYSQCVTDGMCTLPSHIGSPNEKVYYGNPKYENYPVIYVNWDMAKAYCQWAGRDLPTEFQWEKAARGVNGLTYPWGEKFDGRLLNYCDVNCANHNKADNRYNDENVNLAPVGYYQNGASVYGVLDMSGNVWEWINDWYDVYPNGIPTASAYFGQKLHVIKGGSWVHNMYEARSSNRSYYSVGSDAFNDYTGFRCARPK